MDDKKYILLQHEKTISYDEDNCYVNDLPFQKEENDLRTAKQIANSLKTDFYNSFFSKHYKNYVVLAAAGTSMDNGANSGKSREGLWDDCKTEINYVLENCPKIKSKNFESSKNIEGLLSAILLHEKVNEEIIDEGESVRKKLEKKIAEACSLELDSSIAPHKDFLNKIIARKPSDPRVQLFTTNYDTLFEQAGNEAGFVVIDGFSFSQPRRFSGRFFDYDIVNREKTRLKHEESFVSKVFHLYKMHGSLNWERDGDNIIQKETPQEPLIVYPASEKYESSFEQPYFEMMSRFQQVLRKENTLLVVIGFGFQDKHIQNVIIEAVEQNPSFQLVIVNYNDDKSINKDELNSFFQDVNNMKIKRNVSIVFDTFSSFSNNLPSNSTYIDKLKNTTHESI